MLRKLWRIFVIGGSILSMVALIGWYALDEISKQVIVRGLVSFAKENALVEGSGQQQTLLEALEKYLPTPTPSKNAGGDNTTTALGENPSNSSTSSNSSNSSSTNKPTGSKRKVMVKLTPEKRKEIEAQIDPADINTLKGIAASSLPSGDYNTLMGIVFSGSGNEAQARAILSKLSKQQKSTIRSIYGKYVDLLFE